MNNLVKINEVSSKYNISTRTLRYYEDVGLISSVRKPEYAYRLYDNETIIRLEQILVMRKLNISIKDIQRIFSSDKFDALLTILKEKVNTIEDEVSLLQELKEVVTSFIKQLEKYNLSKDTNLNLLYEEANLTKNIFDEVENNNDLSVEKLLKVTEKLEKMPFIRIVKLPSLRMVRSGNTELEEFSNWFSDIETMYPRDFMWYNPKLECFEWLYALPEGFNNTNGYETFEFPGGLYAVATAFDEGEEIMRINKLIHKWVDNSEEFEVSNSDNDLNERYDMGHIITPQGVYRPQMDLFIPIVTKKQ